MTEALGRSPFDDLEDDALKLLAQRLATAAGAVGDLQRIEANGPSSTALRSARTALVLASEVDAKLVAPAARTLFARTAQLVRGAPDAYARVVGSLSGLRESVGSALRIPHAIRIDVPAGFLEALGIFESWASRILRFFSIKWWRARR